MTKTLNTAKTPIRSRLNVLWTFVRPHWKTLALGLILGLGASAAGLANPMITRWVLDSLGTSGALVTPVSILAGLLVAGAIVSWLQWIVLGKLAENIVYTAREGMIRRYLRGKVLPLLRRSPGELVTRVTSDSVLLREAASSSLVELLNGIVMLTGTLILMAILDVPLLIATLVTVAIIGVVFTFLMPAIGYAQEQAQSALGSLGGSLERTVRAIKTVKVAGAETRQESALLADAARARDFGIIAMRREALVWTIASAGIQGAIILILSLGAWRVSLGDMTVSTLVAFLLYAFGLLGPITNISTSLTTLQAGMAAAGRIQEIDDIEFESRNASTEVVPEETKSVVELNNVTARYSPKGPAILNKVSLSIPTQGHVALVGPSGAGKTSVFSLLLDFLQPEEGQLLLRKTPYEELGPTQIRKHFAYVEQESPTIPGTLRENLTFSAQHATDEQLVDALKAVRLDNLLSTLPEGLDTPVSDTTVSGGQRQRIALARALLTEPDVLLLDEVTAQVDGISEAAIHDAIRFHSSRAAVVTIAHRLSTVVDADTIVVMDEGKITAMGTHQQLLQTSPLYQELVQSLAIPDSTTLNQ